MFGLFVVVSDVFIPLLFHSVSSLKLLPAPFHTFSWLVTGSSTINPLRCLPLHPPVACSGLLFPKKNLVSAQSWLEPTKLGFKGKEQKYSDYRIHPPLTQSTPLYLGPLTFPEVFFEVVQNKVKPENSETLYKVITLSKNLLVCLVFDTLQK